MKKIFTLLLSTLVVTMAMAQPMEGLFKKINGTAPEIDGVVDDVWATATAYNITRASGTPTLGEEGETTWKGMWNEEGVFILLNVTDDEFYPAYMIPTNNTWEYDKPELYFDVNTSLVDGAGPNPNKAGFQGHHQFAPGFTESKNDGTPTTDNGMIYAFKVDGSNYVAEYFIPYSRLTTNNNNMEVDITGEIGFDVYILDRDPGTASRSAGVWSNDNPNGGGESWDNMDESGRVLFEGAEPGIDITKITLSGETAITTDNGTLQLTCAVEPLDATQAYKWVITNETGRATINNGLVTAQRDGIVKVKAISVDEFTPSNEITITISGQIITMDEINLIKNGNFEIDSKEGVLGAAEWGRNPAEAWAVEDGWLNATATPKTNIWDIMAYQAVSVDATSKYIIKFKAKGSVNMDVPFITEDIKSNYNKAVVSSSPLRTGDYWTIPVTTEPQWFEFDVTHTSFVEDKSIYQISWQVGKLDGVLSVDSAMMYKEVDLALLSTSSKTYSENSVNVYPNPVENTLYVDLKSVNSKVAIYNSVGQKLMEKTATSNRVQFDVSALRKGMYIVRLENGNTQKFIK